MDCYKSMMNDALFQVNDELMRPNRRPWIVTRRRSAAVSTPRAAARTCYTSSQCCSIHAACRCTDLLHVVAVLQDPRRVPLHGLVRAVEHGDEGHSGGLLLPDQPPDVCRPVPLSALQVAPALRVAAAVGVAAAAERLRRQVAQRADGGSRDLGGWVAEERHEGLERGGVLQHRVRPGPALRKVS
eukprot:CAMPEP_0182862586 /NCGR_PEP_ID=MMETSP0034_2-20130328/6152_1 /TAXON_ID=156128 /ORGANISM="Nephroselmis pyriformis, Strain CCMP717" /LENGTH=184 /DNA_ID=CAMNT_0024994671 /DNA_START=183 /DNA_END=734 /DNA_ORIENTATION=+